MDRRRFLKLQVPVLVTTGGLLVISTAVLRSTMCIEGGTVLGYPWYFFAQCYAMGPQGPLGPPEFLVTGFLLDVAFWYLIALILVLVGSWIMAGRRRTGLATLPDAPESNPARNDR